MIKTSDLVKKEMEEYLAKKKQQEEEDAKRVIS